MCLFRYVNPKAKISCFDNLPADCLDNCPTTSMLDGCKLTCVGLRDYNCRPSSYITFFTPVKTNLDMLINCQSFRMPGVGMVFLHPLFFIFFSFFLAISSFGQRQPDVSSTWSLPKITEIIYPFPF